MKNYISLIVLLVVFGFGGNPLAAQTTIFEQSLLTQNSFNTFSTYNITGTQSWSFSSFYGAVCSGYESGQSFENEDWFVSPTINLSQTDNVKLTFNHARGSAAVLNVGVEQGYYKVFVTADFTGEPMTTQWVELGFNQAVTGAWQYVASGELVIPNEAKSENSRIAFRYISMAGQSATWEIKNVKVTGEPEATNPNSGLFKITNWNTEWLGCTLFGPTDENLQISNVAAAMLTMNSDIYCIQEVSNSVLNPSMETLVSLLGSDQWAGQIVPATADDCSQKQGIIYKKSKVEFVSAAQLSNGNASQGNSYYYNWSSGRFPALYNVNLVVGNTLVPISLVNVHAKAEDGNAMSYTRRLGGFDALKTILDGQNYNTKNVVIIGDFNDYPIGTASGSCGCTDSPFKNFIDDQSNYNCITQNIIDVGWGGNRIIENIIISDELLGNYVSNSASQEESVSQSIDNYYYTTSDHLPVSATLQFSTLANQQYSYTPRSAWAIYPNPVKDQLKFDASGIKNGFVTQIYDLTGRQIRFEKIDSNTLNVADLPSGIYILKAGDRHGRFVKE